MAYQILRHTFYDIRFLDVLIVLFALWYLLTDERFEIVQPDVKAIQGFVKLLKIYKEHMNVLYKALFSNKSFKVVSKTVFFLRFVET